MPPVIIIAMDYVERTIYSDYYGSNSPLVGAKGGGVCLLFSVANILVQERFGKGGGEGVIIIRPW